MFLGLPRTILERGAARVIQGERRMKKKKKLRSRKVGLFGRRQELFAGASWNM